MLEELGVDPRRILEVVKPLYGLNDSPRRRVLFYASFKASGARVPPGTLLYPLRGKHRLADWRACWEGGSPRARECTRE